MGEITPQTHRMNLDDIVIVIAADSVAATICL
jgi:hypothetical protein